MKCDQGRCCLSGACSPRARSSGTRILGGARCAVGRFDTDKHRGVWLAGLQCVGPACGKSYLTFLLAFSLS